MKPDYIAFDADDTLWHNETIFKLTHEKFAQLLSPYHSPDWIEQKLFETEMRNLSDFGYGIKGFTLSMIETAIQLTEERITGREIHEIIDYARNMVKAPVVLLDHVADTLPRLAQKFRLLLITKGDLFDQESKIARSGLDHYFSHIEIVTKKTTDAYAAIFNKRNIRPPQLLMVGNSLKSDILPILQLGGRGVFIPYPLCWEHEKLDPAELEPFHQNLFQLEHMGQLPGLLDSWR